MHTTAKSFMFTGTPTKPTLLPDNKDPTDGESLTLTCTSTTAGITKYQFNKDGVTLPSFGTGQTYTIHSLNLTSFDGTYNCVAYIDSVKSAASDGVPLKGQSNLNVYSI